MTIALGILASDGIVIAADREESDGYLKTSTGKIAICFRGYAPVGQIAVTGAGDAASLDEVSGLLTDKFCSGRDQDASRTSELIAEHRAYYDAQILPFVSQSQSERPDYSLIMGCIGGGVGSGLFATNRLAFNETKHYEAVGIGATVAKDWLSRLYDRVPVVYAARLAAYVIYQVKNSVGNCGLGTDVAVLRPGSLGETISSSAISKWEEMFRQYRGVERNVFYHCIGLEADERFLQRTKLGKELLDVELDQFRKQFMPSDAQKSGDQQ